MGGGGLGMCFPPAYCRAEATKERVFSVLLNGTARVRSVDSIGFNALQQSESVLLTFSETKLVGACELFLATFPSANASFVCALPPPPPPPHHLNTTSTTSNSFAKFVFRLLRYKTQTLAHAGMGMIKCFGTSRNYMIYCDKLTKLLAINSTFYKNTISERQTSRHRTRQAMAI